MMPISVMGVFSSGITLILVWFLELGVDHVAITGRLLPIGGLLIVYAKRTGT